MPVRVTRTIVINGLKTGLRRQSESKFGQCLQTYPADIITAMSRWTVNYCN